MAKKLISIVSSCFNEAENVDELYRRLTVQTDQLKDKYDFEFILLDNHSTDNTASKLRALASADTRVKVILNARNFGHIRSPYWGMLQARGDAIIYLASDLQDPPEMIPTFLEKWEQDYKIALGQKTQSEESFIFFFLRKSFYGLINRINDTGSDLVKNCTGFGLYDRRVIELFRSTEDGYPYLRGLMCELGFDKALIPFTQPTRKRGLSKNNFYTLYDIAMLGIIKHSKVPLRLMTFSGFVFSFISILIALGYFLYKIFHWDSFSLGTAPLIIGLFFFGSIQLLFLGVLGEYIGAIWTRVDKKPIVVEKERINFDLAPTTNTKPKIIKKNNRRI